MKFILCFSLLIFFVSCGNKGGGSGTGSSTNPVESSKPAFPSTCDVAFSKEDSLKKIALKANQARLECGLTEEMVIELINTSL